MAFSLESKGIIIFMFHPGSEVSWHGAYRKAEAFDEAVEQWVRSGW